MRFITKIRRSNGDGGMNGNASGPKIVPSTQGTSITNPQPMRPNLV